MATCKYIAGDAVEIRTKGDGIYCGKPVAREEAYLERRFGDAYQDYKARVRRWL